MRLLIISNRLPVTVEVKKDHINLKESVGGLATGISSYLASLKGSTNTRGYKWIGWPGIHISDKIKSGLELKCRELNIHPVHLDEKMMDDFYNGFCNKTLWPLFHYFPSYTHYEAEQWQQYKNVNKIFSEETLKISKENDHIWIHDYHLMLLPALLRKRLPKLKIGFFLHIPFPSYELFRLLPKEWRKEIVEGLLGADLIGFHTFDYARDFLHSVMHLTGFDHDSGLVYLPDRTVKVDSFPMGIEYEKFYKAVDSEEAINEKNEIQKTLENTKLLLSIDRLDYSKGIINRLKGYENFLTRYPEWLEKITMLLVVVPSRIGVEQYTEMKREIDEFVGYLNGKYGTLGWMPIIYQYRLIPLNALAGIYNVSDIALITPLRDGMNLIAKEYITCRKNKKGVLILSEMAGAARELGEAIIVNPNDSNEIGDAINYALNMKEGEQVMRNTIMQIRLKRYNVKKWAGDFLHTLDDIKKIQSKREFQYLDGNIIREMLKDYKSAGQRIIFLDYDGTLVDFSHHPQLAFPKEDLLKLLTDLSKLKNTDIVLISGRDRTTLSNWFKNVPFKIVAEHGLWWRNEKGHWEKIRKPDNRWKKNILTIISKYTDLLPGSFIEDKENSIAWHYRNSDPEQSRFRAQEVYDNLLMLTQKKKVELLKGNKVLEIKSSLVSKGNMALKFLNDFKYDFILALGDDETDEEMFKSLPESAYTIKVGLSFSFAKYNLIDINEVINLLKRITYE
ncbi:MAG: bifunctional alpha,alpha-trehalose-phosphate synthase (UDP-forming)/trehalose-phosphatase [Ignavibacteria bacterium]|nr:bifunctional alpha,alpha-trehalose-phosphate synthase (UDP-forming)/trehalose-phosphatase [Ignavibacteria bacterium]